MKNHSGNMHKKAISFIREKSKSDDLNLNKMALDSPEQAINYIHGEYKAAAAYIKQRYQF